MRESWKMGVKRERTIERVLRFDPVRIRRVVDGSFEIRLDRQSLEHIPA
jgi:hypothetical protein